MAQLLRVLVLVMVSGAASAQALESFALTVGGDSSGPGCSTFGPPAQDSSFFSILSGISIPSPGFAPCAVAGEIKDEIGAVAHISQSSQLAANWGAGTGSSIIATGGSSASQGHLGAEGHSAYVGASSGTTVVGGEGIARFDELFTFTSPSVANGQSGTVRFLIAISGHLATDALAYANVVAEYRAPPTPSGSFSLFYVQASDATSLPFTLTLGGQPLTGFASSNGAFSGSGTFATNDIPLVFGTPFLFRLGLRAATLPRQSSQSQSVWSVHVTGIQLSGPSGPVASFAVSTASGTAYGPGGVLAPPVPVLPYEARR